MMIHNSKPVASDINVYIPAKCPYITLYICHPETISQKFFFC